MIYVWQTDILGILSKIELIQDEYQKNSNQFTVNVRIYRVSRKTWVIDVLNKIFKNLVLFGFYNKMRRKKFKNIFGTLKKTFVKPN